MMVRSVLFVVMAVTAVGCGTLRVDVSGHSMSPAFEDGDSALATRRFDVLERGDVVGLRSPRDESRNLLQRIVGMPGDRLESLEGRIYIGGEAIAEPYVLDANRSRDTWGPVLLGADEFFTMGDNRRNSSDSRHWGVVRRDAIWAKVLD